MSLLPLKLRVRNVLVSKIKQADLPPYLIPLIERPLGQMSEASIRSLCSEIASLADQLKAECDRDEETQTLDMHLPRGPADVKTLDALERDQRDAEYIKKPALIGQLWR